VTEWYVAEGRTCAAASIARCALKIACAMSAAATIAWGPASHAQTAPAGTPPASGPEEQTAAAAAGGLRDLDAMTFGCAKAALNAAAREAGQVPSQGTYQFSYFNILSDSHRSSYDIRFKSNAQGEADLKYCVSMYCQQGWDPRTTKATVKKTTTGCGKGH
jgi:hypothetical protein